jgi:hypothetical protein
MLDVAAKCRALLLTRMCAQGNKGRSASAAWFQYWGLKTNRANPPPPPNYRRIPKSLGYLSTYALEMAFIEPSRKGQTLRALRRKVYEILRTISMPGNMPGEMRVTQLHPTTVGQGCGQIYMRNRRLAALKPFGKLSFMTSSRQMSVCTTFTSPTPTCVERVAGKTPEFTG